MFSIPEKIRKALSKSKLGSIVLLLLLVVWELLSDRFASWANKKIDEESGATMDFLAPIVKELAIAPLGYTIAFAVVVFLVIFLHAYLTEPNKEVLASKLKNQQQGNESFERPKFDSFWRQIRDWANELNCSVKVIDQSENSVVLEIVLETECPIQLFIDSKQGAEIHLVISGVVGISDSTRRAFSEIGTMQTKGILRNISIELKRRNLYYGFEFEPHIGNSKHLGKPKNIRHIIFYSEHNGSGLQTKSDFKYHTQNINNTMLLVLDLIDRELLDDIRDMKQIVKSLKVLSGDIYDSVLENYSKDKYQEQLSARIYHAADTLEKEGIFNGHELDGHEENLDTRKDAANKIAAGVSALARKYHIRLEG